MPNSNQRGNTRQRKARKLWLLTTFGDGTKAPCWECGFLVTTDTIVVDRIIPYIEGGTYRRNNIRVHCETCSHRQGQRITTQRRKANGSYGRKLDGTFQNRDTA